MCVFVISDRPIILVLYVIFVLQIGSGPSINDVTITDDCLQIITYPLITRHYKSLTPLGAKSWDQLIHRFSQCSGLISIYIYIYILGWSLFQKLCQMNRVPLKGFQIG